MSDDYFEWAAVRYHEHTPRRRPSAPAASAKAPVTPASRKTHEPKARAQRSLLQS